MQLKRDAPPVCWRRFGLWWVLACVGGYVGGAVVSFSIFPGMGWPGIRYFLGETWPLSSLFSLLSLLHPYLGPIFASMLQLLVLRTYMDNSFRWVKFTTIGAVCGAAVTYAVSTFDPFSAFQSLCGLIDCGTEWDQYSEDFAPIWLTYGMVFAFVTYLPIAISQGTAWRPLALPLAWWCLVTTGSGLLPNILLILLVVPFESALEQFSNWMMGAVLLTLLLNLILAAFTGVALGFATALFIIPLLRRAKGHNGL